MATLAPAGARKIVTIVFSDLVGSTALGESLDPEALREVLDRYFTEMRSCLERHGGIVEKYIGDAVMAVFGLPRAHEDDAIRAVRAAAEMRATLEDLNEELSAGWGVRLTNRTGVHTGEVVTGDPATGQRLVTGDAVNTAARLEQAAPHGEVLVGEPTYRLATGGIKVEAVEPVVAKGKSGPVPAYRLISLTGGDATVRRQDHAIVGRGTESRALLDAFDRAGRERRCVLTTVVGEAGVGKTRLVEDALSRIGGRARVAEGRCLPYGEAITYWPLSQAVRQLAGIAEADARDDALRKLAALCDGVGEPDMVVERVATAMGLATESFAREELAWAFRQLIEGVARDQPLVLVLDDIQWGEPTLLETIVHIAKLAGAVPVLLLCMARPELDDAFSGWADDVDGRVIVSLEPLSEADCQTLVTELLGQIGVPEGTLRRIVAAAGGNPLFIEQMLSMWQDEGILTVASGGWELASALKDPPIPGSIQALLAARLDGLSESDRVVLQCGAVIGQIFYRDAVETMSSGAPAEPVHAALNTLERRRLIRPEDAAAFDHHAFAFVHLLVRDAAYAATLKRRRAELHERFADWLLERAADRLPEFEEIVAYHLERSYRSLVELGIQAERMQELRDRAARHLLAAARRTFATNDMRAAAALFDRAVSILPEDGPPPIGALLDFGTALVEVGEFDRARSILRSAEETARSMADLRSETLVRLTLDLLSFKDEPEVTTEDLRPRAASAIGIFQQLDDDLGLAKAFHAQGEIEWRSCRFADAERAFRKAIDHAERAGERREVSDNLTWVAVGLYLGPTHVDDALRACAAILDRAKGDRLVEMFARDANAGLLAMRGDFDEARGIMRRNRGAWQDLGWVVEEAAASQLYADVELLAGDLEAAERELRQGCEVLDRMGEKGILSTTAGMLAGVLASQGQWEAADRHIAVSVESGATDDIRTQVEWRMAKAQVLLAHGNPVRAAYVAGEALELAERTDQPNLRGGARMHLARTLQAAGRIQEALPHAHVALAEYGRKGNVVQATRARELVAELR